MIYILFSPPLTCQAKMDPWITVLGHIPWHKMVFQLCYHVKEGKAMNNCLLIKLKKSSTKLTVGQLTADRLPTRTRRNGQQQLTNGRLQSTDRQLTDNRTTPDRQATGNGQTTVRRWTDDQQVTDNWQKPNKRAITDRQPKTNDRQTPGFPHTNEIRPRDSRRDDPQSSLLTEIWFSTRKTKMKSELSKRGEGAGA